MDKRGAKSGKKGWCGPHLGRVAVVVEDDVDDAVERVRLVDVRVRVEGPVRREELVQFQRASLRKVGPDEVELALPLRETLQPRGIVVLVEGVELEQRAVDGVLDLWRHVLVARRVLALVATVLVAQAQGALDGAVVDSVQPERLVGLQGT